MAWTAPKTWSSGTLSSAELNEQIRDNETWLKAALTAIGQTSDSTFGQLKSAAYGCILNRTAAQSISDSTDTAITFPTGSVTEELDTDGMHSGSTNTARITVPAGGSGVYLIGGNVRWETNATGARVLWAEYNGSAGTGTVIAESRIASSGGATQTSQLVSTVYLLADGDYVTMNVRQTSGGARDVQSAGFSARFYALRLFSV